MAPPVVRLAAAALILSVGLAEAKPLSRMLAQSGLAPEDITMMTAAADTLFAGAPQPGAREDWQNTESGSRGNVQILSVGDGCAVLRHQFRPGGADRTQQVQNQRCRNAQGQWVAD